MIPTKTENQNQKPKIPSFPRKWESSGNLGRRVKKTYIPSFPQKQKTKIRNLKSRHSRKSGNPKTKSRRNLTEEPNPENRLPAFA
ncbi:hypothetical protein BC489_07190 [Neisseria meningitidis]|nr:hypothetical protein BC489_07190 [Neisseria meningitidis]